MSADTLLELPLETPFKAPPPRPSPSRRPLLESSCYRFSAVCDPVRDEAKVLVTVAMQASGEDVLKLHIHRTHTLYDLESTLLCLFQSYWFPGPFPLPRGTSVRVVGLHEQGPLDKVLDLLEAAADDRIRIVCVPEDESTCIIRVHKCYRAYDPTSGAQDVLVVLHNKKGEFFAGPIWCGIKVESIRASEHTSIELSHIALPDPDNYDDDNGYGDFSE